MNRKIDSIMIKDNSMECYRWGTGLMLFIMSMLMPQMASATDVDDASNYKVTPMGIREISIACPIVDQDGADCWVVDGNLIVSVDGGPKITVLHWSCYDNNDSGTMRTYVKTDANGEVYITNVSNSKPVLLTKGVQTLQKVEQGSKSYLYSLKAKWNIPDDYFGKELKFTWDVKRDGNARYKEKVSGLPDFEWSVPDSPPVLDVMVSEPLILPDNAGKILVPWMLGSNDIQKAEAYYYDVNNQEVRMPVDIKNGSNMVSLDATSPHRGFYIETDYKDTYGSLIKNVRNQPVDIKMIHAPLNFKGSLTNDSLLSIILTWNIFAQNDDDLLESDLFEIQRSLNGKDGNYTTIGVEMLDLSKRNYSFKDSTLIPSLTADMFNEDGSVKDIYYRIRRACTDMWGWYPENNTVAAFSIKPNIPSLFMVKKAWIEKDSQNEYAVTAAWDYNTYLDEEDWFHHQFVWDDRAQMKLKVKMCNRKGEIVDTQEYILTKDEIYAKKKKLTFSRPCVNYYVEITVDRGTSPIGTGIRGITINSKNEWDDLVQEIRQNSLNALKYYVQLNADFEIPQTNNEDFLMGTKNRPFVGIFNGNGHTIKANGNPIFNYAKNAKICNLNVVQEGRSNYHYDNLACMVNDADNVVVSNSTVTADLDRFKKIAGFVFKAKDVTINNCLSTLKWRRDTDNDSFAGFIYNSISGNTIVNSYFCSDNLDSKFGKDFYYDGACTLVNCWYPRSIKEYTFTDGQGKEYWREDPDNPPLTEILGDQWESADNVPGDLPFKLSEVWPVVAPIDTETNTLVTSAMGSTFYYESSGKVDKPITAITLQSSVVIQWSVSDGAVDYFEVMRREQGKQEWSVIATDLTELSYEDKKVSPHKKYEYKVRSAVNCEGTSYHYSDSVAGFCKETCLIEGYVRFSDGTGISNITLSVTGPNGIHVGDYLTDEKGKFVIDNLSYYGNSSVTYKVGVVSEDDLKLELSEYQVTFNDTINHRVLKDFIVTSGYRFTGFVMYEGTSIPVQGANVSVDGHDIYLPTGKLLETDFSGKFSFIVLGGKRDIVVKMDGHQFKDGGKFTHVFTDKLSSIYFYDKTSVKLIGRVVGGDTQGNLPLGQNLSTNNLGSDITMVLTLEGDNVSNIVSDNTNPTLAERDTVFHNGKSAGDSNDYITKVKMYRKRIVVKPDSLTGEFTLMLPPVKWKVQQIYCEGYASLFQEGKVSDIIDLTNCVERQQMTYEGAWTNHAGVTITNPMVEYNAIYNRIYHSPVELTYSQMGYSTFDYYGDFSYTATNIGGGTDVVPLVYQVPDEKAGKGSGKVMKTKYTFEHPVFTVNRKYTYKLAAVERYYWNNNHSSDTVDLVQMNGGKVRVHNGLYSSTHFEDIDLDDHGEGYMDLEVAQVNYNLTKKDALRTVTMTLDLDGKTYEAEPLKAYIFNLYTFAGASDVLNSSKPTLVDILRDPPGGGSFATLSKGSTLKYTYAMDLKWSAGVSMDFKTGTGMNNYYGFVMSTSAGMLGPSYGVIQDSKTGFQYKNDILFSGKGNRAFEYTMTSTEDISTSSAASMVGAPADIYIGMVQNNVVKKGVTIRAIPDRIFKQMEGRLPGAILPDGSKDKAGTMVEIACGKDANDSIYHLVRDESLVLGANIESTFVHSQNYIIKQLLPDLVEKCRSLMFIGTPDEAQAQANATGNNVYLSLRTPDDENFAMMNSSYYTLKMHQSDERKEDMNYCVVTPNGDIDPVQKDEVQKYCGIMYEWINMIVRNEEEKLNADELVQNIDVDGGSKNNYSENFETSYSTSSSTIWPLGINADNFLSATGNEGENIANALSIFGNTFGKFYINILQKAMKTSDIEADWLSSETEVNFTGSSFKYLFYPVMSYDVTPNNTTKQTYNRKESFSISMNNASHLNVDVYRAKSVVGSTKKSKDVMDVFTSQNFYAQVDYNNDYLKRHLDLGSNDTPVRFARGFVYRTRGGATAQPWEDERKTVFYNSGTVLDTRTKKIENPKITLDKQSISGVPYGEPARFKLYMTNDSEEPNSVTGGLSYYNLYLNDASNPNGAKLIIDGIPLSGNPREIYVPFGQVTEKTLEVYAGEEFDYEGLQLSLISKGDSKTLDMVKFDVHFLHTAGAVNISTPGDKWVMNTDAPYHEKRGYFLPVKIDGFDRKQKNFDHIEFQYKESSRGDDHWTNLCSYYDSDTLMAKASGNKLKIPDNGYISTEFYGEGIVMEMAYDLRAVLFIRNGNGFITSSSKVLSGIKDTRRPSLFGTPEPSDGILDIGENVIFNFSEDIQHNYLDQKTNFEVKGEVNNDNVSEAVSIEFQGESSVETDAMRNFTGKDITISMMVLPESTGKPMPLFSHGTDNKKLQFWLTEDFRLKAVVDDQSFETEKAVEFDTFKQLSMVIRQPEKEQDPCTLTLYSGGVSYGEYDLAVPYTGTGALIFGRTNEKNRTDANCSFYKGRMMEARLWYRALTGIQIGTVYGNKRLTGYELGLVDYYPMNEGEGDHAVDKAQGAHARLFDASWVQPRGMSLHLDKEDKGMALSQDAFNRTDDEDYTLMFWFKTNSEGRGALISNGSGQASDIDARNQFFIGFEAERLYYRSNGMEIEITGDYSDNKWHHYAMTVNRSSNIGNIYMDRELKATFSVDNLGGVSGGYPMLGATLHKTVDGNVVEDTQNWFKGNIDEICVFEQALPLSLIKSYSLKSPYGDEAGLLTYMGFSRQERQQNNNLEFVPYVYSQRIYKDDQGNMRYELDPLTKQPTNTPVRDFIFDESSVKPQDVMAHIDQTEGAPVKPYEELKNLNFSFVGRDNQLLVNIDEPTEYINKRNIYVTVRDIPDMNSNAMASPATISCFIDRNPLRWKEKTQKYVIPYGEGQVFDVLIKNVSGSAHTYEVTNTPRWLTVSPMTNTISAKDETLLQFSVNKNLNVGTYDEIIYLTDENGLSEPMSLSVTIYGEAPDWEASRDLRQYTMNIVGRVVMGSHDNNQLVTDSRDVVGAFDRKGICHGVANISYDEQTGSSMLYLTVYNNSTQIDELYFKLWHYATGKEMILTNYDNISFVPSKLYGSKNSPCIFYADNQYVQTLHLEKGWNWVSFNVYSESFKDLNRLLDGFDWQNGDILTDNTNNMTLVYSDNHWTLSEKIENLSINPRNFYAVRVSKDITVQLAGYTVKDKSDRTIKINPEWNSIGYTPMVNLPVETALAGYFPYAKDGDIIKSHDEFAVFNEYGGSGHWEGSLQYMKPGEGYMLYHNSTDKVTFEYPFYEPGSMFIDANYAPPSPNMHLSMANTMSLTATAVGVTLEPGDKLLAFADGDLRGEATVESDSIFYLSIGGDHQQGISFAIEREGEIVATTPEVITYTTNTVMGRKDTPTRIDFTQTEAKPQQGWYTLEGVKLPSRPTKKGVYIFNGKKIVIEN